MKVFRDWQIQRRHRMAQAHVSAGQAQHRLLHSHLGPGSQRALFEPHHNTYDIEFWGPEPMCTSIYIGALSRHGAMASAVGELDDAKFYGDLARTSANYMDEHLFNGEYYQQKVQFEDLHDKSFAQ